MPKSCPVCGSRKWRKDGVTGNAVCEDGHVFQDFRSENLVVENVGHTLQKRSTRRGERRNKRKEDGRANAELYHGEEAEWLRLQALQLMLRLQVTEIGKLWDLPEVLERIVRELWAYQLAISPLPSPPGSSGSRYGSAIPQNDEKMDDAGNEKSDDKHDGVDEDSDSSSDEDERDKEEELADDDLFAEVSERSESEDDTDQRDKGRLGGQGPVWRRKRRLRVSDTLVTLILGLWMVRVPVVNVDIQMLVNGNRLPYLDFAHTTHIPSEMYAKMDRDTRVALTPRKSPTPLFLFDESKMLARTLQRHFGLGIPEINLSPISWRLIHSLGGTPNTYHQVHRLLALLDVNLNLIDTDFGTYTRKARRGRKGDDSSSVREIRLIRTKRNNDVILPELSIVAAWVMVMKMAYGLDGRPRVPSRLSDAAIRMPDPDRLISELSGRLQSGALREDQKWLGTKNFAAMDKDELDRYLDQCQTVLLGNHTLSTDAGPFPLDPVSGTQTAKPESWAEFHKNTPLTAINPENQVGVELEPGEMVRSWDPKDVTGELPAGYETVLSAAAEVAGVGPYDVGVVVEVYERKLERMKRDRSRSVSRSRSRAVSVGQGRR